jgi:fatty acid desaturase
MVRLFILFHDCVHGSFFRRQNVNTFFGYFLGVLVFTPFEDWRFAHLRHHVTYANLDARGFGDIWTMTLTEYENVSRKRRLQYRLYRNPVVMIGLISLRGTGQAKSLHFQSLDSKHRCFGCLFRSFSPQNERNRDVDYYLLMTNNWFSTMKTSIFDIFR